MSADNIEIRKSTQLDTDAILRIYPFAFPDENLIPLVRDLLSCAEIATSLIAVSDTRIVGHAVFTQCCVSDQNLNISLLGPLAVHPDLQKQGIGSGIVGEGMTQLTSSGVEVLCVLGDPEYYSRFGFLPDIKIEPPFDLPSEYKNGWQSIYLNNSVVESSGTLVVPSQWDRPSLWFQ